MLTKAASRKQAQRAYPKLKRCERCGMTEIKLLNRHHSNYQHALSVEVLCTKCHVKADQGSGHRPIPFDTMDNRMTIHLPPNVARALRVLRAQRVLHKQDDLSFVGTVTWLLEQEMDRQRKAGTWPKWLLKQEATS